MKILFFAIGFFVGFAACVFMYYLIDRLERDTRVIKEGHVAPKYYGYEWGYTTITECGSCRRTALIQDQHTTKPCPSCGGIIIESGAAVWKEKDGEFQWVKSIKHS